MIRYFLKIIYRNFIFHKSNVILKTLGLIFGLTISLLVFEYLIFEKSYDKFYKNYQNIYRLGRQRYNSAEDEINDPGISTSLKAGPVLKEESTDIIDYVRIHPMYGEATVQVNETSFNEEKLFFSDPSFFNIFSTDIIQGNPNTFLNNPEDVVLSESLAKKYFGNQNPLGKHIKLYSRYTTSDYTVTGIYKDFPDNTHLEIDALFSNGRLMNIRLYNRDNPWKWGNFRTYIKTKGLINSEILAQRLKKITEERKVAEQIGAYKVEYYATAISDIHLDGKRSYLENHNSGISIYLFLITGILIVITSFFNYINLSVSGFLFNFKLFKFRPQLGLTQNQTGLLFIFETLIINTISFSLAIILVLILKPLFTEFTGLNIQLSNQTELLFWLITYFIVTVKSIFSAYLAQFFHNKGKTLNNVHFLIMQYTTSFILLVVSLMAIKQVVFLKKQDIGIDINHVITIKTPKIINPDITERNVHEVFRDEISKIPGVKAVTNSVYVPGDYIASIQTTGIKGKEQEKFLTRINYTGYEYTDVYKNKLLAGRFLSQNEGAFEKVVINKTASKIYGFENPEDAIGKTLFHYHNNRQSEIIGVIDDYNHESPDVPMYAMAIYKVQNINGYYSVNLSSVNYDIINKIKKVFETIHPGNPCDMAFVNQTYEKQYTHFNQQIKVFSLFTFVALFISIFGLVGIVKLTIQKKIKEIGIRKVNGAKMNNILSVLNQQYLRSLLLSMVIGFPVSMILIKKWMSYFALQTSLSWWIFAISALIVSLISTVTISLQSWKAAKSNPVEALRYE